jgi:transcriptional regulator with XRE-family HTH domain
MSGILGCGARIRAWRKKVPMKGYELSKKLKFSQGSLSDIENGKSLPSALTIHNFMKYTDIDIFWMLTGELDYVPGKEKIDEDPPLEISMNPGVKKLLITYRE